MGITFLAAGTSVPDCMASLIVARQGGFIAGAVPCGELPPALLLLRQRRRVPSATAHGAFFLSLKLKSRTKRKINYVAVAEQLTSSS